MDLAFLDKEANLRKASEMVREAAANGASLICLPEAFNTGYLGSDIPAMKKMAEPLDGESVTVMRKLAAELSVIPNPTRWGMNGLISREETSIRYGIQSLER